MAGDRRLRRILMTADTIGGVWSYALELAQGLVRHGVEVALATMGRVPSEPSSGATRLESKTWRCTRAATAWNGWTIHGTIWSGAENGCSRWRTRWLPILFT